MTGAGTTMQGAAAGALRSIEGLGVYEGPPVQAAVPYAVVEVGPELDWSHKSGMGREVRLAVTVHERGEGGGSLRTLLDQAEEALSQVEDLTGTWKLVSFHFLRSRTLAPKPGTPNGLWLGALEYRARLLRSV